MDEALNNVIDETKAKAEAVVRGKANTPLKWPKKKALRVTWKGQIAPDALRKKRVLKVTWKDSFSYHVIIVVILYRPLNVSECMSYHTFFIIIDSRSYM